LPEVEGMGKHEKQSVCGTCGGSGTLTVTNSSRGGGARQVPCPPCHGSGQA